MLTDKLICVRFIAIKYNMFETQWWGVVGFWNDTESCRVVQDN